MTYGQPAGGQEEFSADSHGFGPPRGDAPMHSGAGEPTTDPIAYVSLAIGALNLLTGFGCGLLSVLFPAGWILTGLLVTMVGLVGAGIGHWSVTRIWRRPELYKGYRLATTARLTSVASVVLGIGMLVFVAGAVAGYY